MIVGTFIAILWPWSYDSVKDYKADSWKETGSLATLWRPGLSTCENKPSRDETSAAVSLLGGAKHSLWWCEHEERVGSIYAEFLALIRCGGGGVQEVEKESREGMEKSIF